MNNRRFFHSLNIILRKYSSTIKRLLAILLFVASVPIVSYTQMGNASEIIEKLHELQTHSGYQKDSAFINTVNQLAFLYADSHPDSALILLDGQAERSLKIRYAYGAVETNKILGNAWQTKGNFDKALKYYNEAYVLAKKNDLEKSIPSILNNIGLIGLNQGNYPEALQKFYETLEAAKTINDSFLIGSALNNIATVDFYLGKMNEADIAYQQTLAIAGGRNDTMRIIIAYNNIGEVNLAQNKSTEALENFKKGFKIALLKNSPELLVMTMINLANTYLEIDSFSQSITYFENALRISKQNDYALEATKTYVGLAKAQLKMKLLKPALANGLEGIDRAQEMGQTQLLRDANKIVADIYEQSGEGMNALKHFKLYMTYSDSLNNVANVRTAANEKANYRISQKQKEFEKATLQQKWVMLSALVAAISLGIILFIIAYNKRRLKLKNKDLEYKNEIINNQKEEVTETLEKLKSTQAQLIQSEKMASLGILTAGIAHEIQNPLNFVNNFSEVSNELMDEMNEEIVKENYEDAKQIANEVKQNLEKITHHGKRADAIVKGMLQHSRTGNGIKEPTDINALCNEYLKLSLNGFQAKLPSLNRRVPIQINTDFDNTIGKLNIIPQEIGRVLLNLFNNACYAVNKKQKETVNNELALYKPTISVTTIKNSGRIEIRIADNGNGIPENIINKIFQPFFTTKSTGEGTGLGLSLSYDIIKAHGGDLLVESKAGEGCLFIISLPLT